MEVFKGGGQQRGRREQTMRVKQVKSRKEVDESEIPLRITVPEQGTVYATVPHSVWRCKAFKWEPKAFVVGNDELNQKFIEPSVQDASLVKFIKNPSAPMIYGVAGNPDDLKAKLFAAYLMDTHCRRYKMDCNPWWVNLNAGFDNPWVAKDRPMPSLVVITGLTDKSTNHKLEKARDILEMYPDVPRIVVIAGADPFTFLATRLHLPINGLAYFCEAIVRQKVEVL